MANQTEKERKMKKALLIVALIAAPAQAAGIYGKPHLGGQAPATCKLGQYADNCSCRDVRIGGRNASVCRWTSLPEKTAPKPVDATEETVSP